MTDTYLRSLGFAPMRHTTPSGRPNFDQAWRYQFDYEARDGACLFIERPFGIASCRLSSLAAPLSSQDVFATVGLQDQPALEKAIKAFYAAHGGMGSLVTTTAPSTFGPYHRQL